MNRPPSNNGSTRLRFLGVAFAAAMLIACSLWSISVWSRGDEGTNHTGSNEYPNSEQGNANVIAGEIANSKVNGDEQTDANPAELALHPSLVDRRYDVAIRNVTVLEDPVLDGWDTEHFSELAGKQLKLVGKLLTHAQSMSEADLSAVCGEQFRGTALRPQRLTPAFDGTYFRVSRGRSTTKVEGLTGFADALKHQAVPFESSTDNDFKFKIIRVSLKNGKAQTKSYFQFNAKTPRGLVQANSTWLVEWQLTDRSQPPRLKRLVVEDYEESAAKRSMPAFSDCTKSLFGDLPLLNDQLVFGRDHWYAKLEAAIGVEGRGNGIAIGDANGDGLDDIYLCQPAALPNQLLLRQTDGSLLNHSSEAGVDWLDGTRGALFVDIDNDGDQDLVVAHSSSLILHENNNTGLFTIRRVLKSDSLLFSLNAVDYDVDGDLDLFACGYSSVGQTRPEDIFASPVPYHDANNGAPNLLLRNDGNWSFENVTHSVGLDDNNLKFSLASVWEDFDNDGDVDLYVANDFGRNNLYRNDGGRFVDIANQAGVEDLGPGMSATWGDYNNDGLMDIYVSNMFSSAGNRITHNAQFKPSASNSDLTGFRRHARGNSLFKNQGAGGFKDIGVASNTTMGRWAWGSQVFDLNNDGLRDIYVTNGFVTADNNNDL